MIAAIVNDLFKSQRSYRSRKSRFAAGRNLYSLSTTPRQLLVDQLCALAGRSLASHIGQDMKRSHAGLGISQVLES